MTTLMRWTPESEFLRNRVGRLFDQTFNEFLSPLTSTEEMRGRGWFPAVDIRETDDSLTVFCEIPGLKKEDVSITLENNVLTISGERKFEKETKEQSYHRMERSYGKFSRSFSLPSNLETSKVDASVQDGVLRISLPKVEAAKPRRIAIK